MNITAYKFQQRVWADDSLSPTDRIILLRVAWEFVIRQPDRFGYLGISNQDIADDTGMVRETVSRNMRWLVANQYLRAARPIHGNRYRLTQYRLDAQGFDRPRPSVNSDQDRPRPSVTQDHATDGSSVNSDHGRTPNENGSSVKSVDVSGQLGLQRTKFNTGDADDAPHSGGGGSDGECDPPPPPEDVTDYLDQLGIRRQRRSAAAQRMHDRRQWRARVEGER